MDSSIESTQCRNRPLARSARRYKGVIGESKEGIGGTRNPPCPPWPPEAPKIKGLLNAELANENQTLEIIERWNQGEYKSATKERSNKRRGRTSSPPHYMSLSFRPSPKPKTARVSIMQTRGHKNFLLLHLQYKLRHKKNPATTYPARRLPAKYFRRDEA